MKYLLLLFFGGWKKTKPEFDSEFLMLTAHETSGEWDYTLWRIMKCNGPDGWYYGLCTQDGEEWGDRDDLAAQLYKKIPLL